MNKQTLLLPLPRLLRSWNLSSNLRVYSPNQSRCESKRYDSNERGSRNIESAWSPEIDMSDIQKPLRDSEIEGVFNSMSLGKAWATTYVPKKVLHG